MPKTKSSTASRNRAAFDNASKKPRIIPVDIIMDSEVADAYQEALTAHNALEGKLADSLPRRLAAERAALPVGASPEDQLEASIKVRNADTEELAPLKAALAAAKEELEGETQRFKFRAIGRAAWERLKEEHPPTEEDHAAAAEATGEEGEKSEYHFDSLAPALLLMSSVSPKLSQENVDAIFKGDTWNDQEIAQLFQTALLAQLTAHQNPLGRAR